MSDQVLKIDPRESVPADLKQFDPFEDSEPTRSLRDAKPRTIAAMIVAGLVAVIVSAILGHRFGPLSAFQPLDDARRLMQVGDPPPSKPDFPLMRDVVSWYLIVMSAATLVIVRRQYRLITKTVPHLSEKRALYWRQTVAGGRLSRRFLAGPVHADGTPQEFLDAALARGQRVVSAIGRFRWLIFLGAAIVAAGYIKGEIDGSFQALAPSHLSPTGLDHWRHEAIDSWWASNANIFGFLTYFLISALMFSAIAAQNGVGYVAIFLFVAMSRVFNFRCDWHNSDGYFGWSPIASLYRVTLLALTFHIAAITSVLWVMGWGRFLYMTLLIVIPVVAILLYLLVPAVIFTRFSRREKARRIDELTSGVEEAAALHLRQSLRSELDYVREAKINPLRPRRREIPASITLIVIPMTLTAVQVIAAING
jgi:hypothetical protein